MLTRAEASVALISEGRCWDCEGPLTSVPDGWADCLRCRRRMRIADGVVYERVRPDREILDRWVEWIADDIEIVRDDSVTPIITSGRGRGYVPADTKWLQMRWPVPQGA